MLFVLCWCGNLGCHCFRSPKRRYQHRPRDVRWEPSLTSSGFLGGTRRAPEQCRAGLLQEAPAWWCRSRCGRALGGHGNTYKDITVIVNRWLCIKRTSSAEAQEPYLFKLRINSFEGPEAHAIAEIDVPILLPHKIWAALRRQGGSRWATSVGTVQEASQYWQHTMRHSPWAPHHPIASRHEWPDRAVPIGIYGDGARVTKMDTMARGSIACKGFTFAEHLGEAQCRRAWCKCL